MVIWLYSDMVKCLNACMVKWLIVKQIPYVIKTIKP
jgi:hypothetical protein